MLSTVIDDTATVAINCEIDMHSVDVLEAVLRAILAGTSRRIVVDLSGVGFMDSSGLRMLVKAHEQMTKEGRWFMTRGATGQPRRLLDIGRIHYGVTI